MDLFDAGLADAEPRKLEQRIAGDFARRHGGDVAEDMRRVGAVGIIAALPDVDIDPRKVRGVDLDAGDLLPVQVLAHRRRDEAAVAPDLAQDAPLFAGRDGNDGAQDVQDGFDVAGVLGVQKHAVVLLVVGHGDAEAIDDASPGRRKKPQVDAVFLGQGPIAAGFDDLQVIHAGRQRRQQNRHTAGDDGGAAAEKLVTFGIPVHISPASGTPAASAGTARPRPGKPPTLAGTGKTPSSVRRG